MEPKKKKTSPLSTSPEDLAPRDRTVKNTLGANDVRRRPPLEAPLTHTHKWRRSRRQQLDSERARGREAAEAHQYPIKQSAKPPEGTKSS